MSDATIQLDALIDRYLGGGQEFMTFWSDFMDLWNSADLSDSEVVAYDDAYEVVYMGSPGSISGNDQAFGLLSEDEVKARLRGFRIRHSGVTPA